MMHSSDLVVVGGGVVGCAVAYYTARKGLKVTLIDQPKRGRASSASAGGTWPLGESLGLGCGIIFYKALLKKGVAHADAIGPEQLPDSFLDFSLQSNAMFPGLAQELKETGGLDMDFDRTTLLFVMLDEADARFARLLLEKFPRDKSLLKEIDREAVNREEPAVRRDNYGGLRFLTDDQVTPYGMADALRAGARACGATIVTHTEVTGVRIDAGRVTAVEAGNEVYPCKAMVNAAGSWAGEVGRMVGVDIPVYPVRGQIVCTETLPRILNACISTSDCYLAQKHNGEIIIGSTTEEVGFDMSVTTEAVRDLCSGALRVFPFLENVRIKRVWCGLRPGTRDELPILGPVDGLEGYYNACGHFRTGVLNAPLTAKILTEIVMGNEPSFDCTPFLLSRFQQQPSLRPSAAEPTAIAAAPVQATVGGAGHSCRRYQGLIDLDILLEEARRTTVEPDQVIVREGEAGDSFYIIALGQVRVDQGGKSVATLGPGEFFGEISLLMDQPRNATVTSMEPVELLVIPRTDFWSFLAKHPTIATNVMHTMTSRLQAMAGSASLKRH